MTDTLFEALNLDSWSKFKHFEAVRLWREVFIALAVADLLLLCFYPSVEVCVMLQNKTDSCNEDLYQWYIYPGNKCSQWWYRHFSEANFVNLHISLFTIVWIYFMCKWTVEKFLLCDKNPVNYNKIVLQN